MRRFTYSPKVWVYINTGGSVGDKKRPPNIIDLTGYTTAGTVNRVINQVSSAEITIRNPQKMWTKPGNPTFHPMDTITIFMMRRKGFPIQVFTGYLDRTPYYQLYPGTCTLTASCTLKRLLHTYFDAALPYTFEFMAKYGWMPTSAGMVNPSAQAASGTSDSSSSGGNSGIADAAKSVSGEGRSYSYGGGHGPVASIGAHTSLDCSSSVSLVLKRAGMFPGSDVLDSSGLASSWGKPGRGKDFTVWGNSGHVFMQSESGPAWRFDTGGPGGGSGPRYRTEHRSTAGFTPRHWEGATSGSGSNSQPAATDKQPPAATAVVTDSSFGKLLYATLTEIGKWDKNQIYIEKLPDNLPDKVGKIYREFEGDNKAANQEFQNMLKDLIGSSSQGTGGGDTQTTDGKAGSYSGPLDHDFGKGSKETISFDDAAMLAEMAGLPGITYAQIAKGESSLQPGAVSNDGGFGLWQMTPRVQSADTVKKWESIGSYFNPWKNALMAKALAGSGTGVSNYFGTGFVTDPNKHYTGTMPKDALTKGAANSDTTSTKGTTSDTSTVVSSLFGGSTPVDSVETASGGSSGGSGASNGADKIFAPIAGNVSYGRGWHESSKGVSGMTDTSGSHHWHSGIDAGCPTGTPCVAPVDGEITMSQANWSDGGMIHFKFPKDTDGTPKGTIIGWGHATNLRSTGPVKAGETIAKSGNPGGGPHVHFILIPAGGADGGGDGTSDPSPILKALQKHTGTPVDGGGGSASADTGSGGSGDSPLAAAFAATLNWPSISEMSESILLQKGKSLMNDKALMPFIEQLAGGSLRQFQSLPDGTFFAFYPDYFGEMGHRKPYWAIDDVEILDGGIDLTDDNLVTHEFVVGDTIPDGQITTIEKLNSGGVVSVFNAFGASDKGGDSIVPSFDGKSGKDAALTFLERYGPRPEYYEAAMVRNQYFEAFLAYQRFMLAWSRQFATQFTFTFMPELYPGGRVAFTGHGLQCYIESVSHSWDYSGGFTTTAVLSAPSAYGGTGDTLAYSSGLVRDTGGGAISVPNADTEGKD